MGLQERLATIEQAFRRTLGMVRSYHGRARGRVNLIGEHTDYNDGFIFQ